jgi:hypothetical protein
MVSIALGSSVRIAGTNRVSLDITPPAKQILIEGSQKGKVEAIYHRYILLYNWESYPLYPLPLIKRKIYTKRG